MSTILKFFRELSEARREPILQSTSAVVSNILSGIFCNVYKVVRNKRTPGYCAREKILHFGISKSPKNAFLNTLYISLKIFFASYKNWVSLYHEILPRKQQHPRKLFMTAYSATLLEPTFLLKTQVLQSFWLQISQQLFFRSVVFTTSSCLNSSQWIV